MRPWRGGGWRSWAVVLLRALTLIFLVLTEAKKGKSTKGRKRLGDSGASVELGRGKMGCEAGPNISVDPLGYAEMLDAGKHHMAAGNLAKAIGCFEVEQCPLLPRPFPSRRRDVSLFTIHASLIPWTFVPPDLLRSETCGSSTDEFTE